MELPFRIGAFSAQGRPLSSEITHIEAHSPAENFRSNTFSLTLVSDDIQKSVRKDSRMMVNYQSLPAANRVWPPSLSSYSLGTGLTAEVRGPNLIPPTLSLEPTHIHSDKDQPQAPRRLPRDLRSLPLYQKHHLAVLMGLLVLLKA